MLEQAKAKLTAEMDGNKNNPYIREVGGFLLKHLETDPGVAKEILAADKTIAKSLDAMRKEAEKKQIGHMAMFTPQEGFELVMKYFGIDQGRNVKPAATPSPAAMSKPESNFEINLDDLLGG